MILKLMKIYKNRPINNMTYTVFSKNNCSFCDRAINLIEDNDHAVIIKKIDEDQAFFLEMRERAPAMRTMPVVFVEDQLIGGYADLVQHFLNK